MVEREQSEATGAPAGRMRWDDGAVYGLALAGIYLLVGVLFFYSGKGKIFDGQGAPPSIEKQFSGTFLSTFPGIDAIWTILGLLELLIALLLVVSLVRLEFLPARRKSFLLAGLSLAVFTFAVLATGQNLTGQNDGVASLFVYAAGTAVFILLVRLMPPYRSGRVTGD